jgi:hypothetical protein
MIKRIKRLSKIFKIVLFILILISGAYISSWALGYGQNNNSDGLVLDMTLSSDYYNADTKTFSDQSGNSNNGVSLNNAVFAPDKDGKSEGAMSFDGSSDHVSVSESSLNARAMSLWFYSNSNSEQVIAGGFLGPTYYSLVYIGNKLSIAGTGGANAKVITQNTYSTNIWHHVVVLRTSLSFPNEFRIFVNGVEQSLEAGGSNRVCQGSRIGARYYSDTFSIFFNGSIENFKVWDRELSVTEIQDLYKQEHIPKLQASSLEKGLVGYWPLNGENFNSNTNRVTDKSAYSNHGTNYGATLTEDRLGRSEGAMGFNGTSQYIGNLDASFLYNVNYSVSAWFKSGSTSLLNTIFATHSSSYGHQIGFLNQPSVGQIAFYSGGGATNDALISTDNNYNDNNWHHAVFVREGNNILLYIDGILDGTKIRNNATLSNIPLQIGRHSSLNRYFNGAMNDIRIYNRSLSADEVRSLYERNAPKISSSSLNKGLVLDMPLISQYTKGGTAGSEIMVDKSPYSHNGQNYGATLGESSVSLSSNLEPLIMNYRLWKDGQSGRIGNFGPSSSGNRRVIAKDPWGRNVVVWESGESGDATYPAAGGIYHDPINIDNTKLYRMSWWEKRVTNAAGTYGNYYAGLNGYGTTNGVINLSNGAYNTNPYFWYQAYNHVDLRVGEWFLVVGHVFPHNHSGTTLHPDSGRYTINGRIGNTFSDYKWAPQTTLARSRTLAIYRGNHPDMVHYTVYPRMDVVDGSEPSIQDLLNSYDSYGHDVVVTVPENKVSVSFWYNDVDSNGWVHVVNSAGIFYVNGEPGTPAKYPIVINGDQVYIGRTTMSDYFAGAVSNLKIYNRALSDTEVKSLYDLKRGELSVILGGN